MGLSSSWPSPEPEPEPGHFWAVPRSRPTSNEFAQQPNERKGDHADTEGSLLEKALLASPHQHGSWEEGAARGEALGNGKYGSRNNICKGDKAPQAVKKTHEVEKTGREVVSRLEGTQTVQCSSEGQEDALEPCGRRIEETVREEGAPCREVQVFRRKSATEPQGEGWANKRWEPPVHPEHWTCRDHPGLKTGSGWGPHAGLLLPLLMPWPAVICAGPAGGPGGRAAWAPALKGAQREGTSSFPQVHSPKRPRSAVSKNEQAWKASTPPTLRPWTHLPHPPRRSQTPPDPAFSPNTPKAPRPNSSYPRLSACLCSGSLPQPASLVSLQAHSRGLGGLSKK